ncbi:MAG: LegC family aminotransferase [Desulforhabdus sp.]|jgi:perosamine synthetase|nr:LegC family aminotransferase [Desulforhabdus sp.]
MKKIAHSVVEVLRSVLPASDFVPLHIPEFEGNEKRLLAECIDSNFVSYLGEFVTRFEGMLSEFTGSKRILATVNGTAALHACLEAVGVKAGDEVLMPALTFVATANAVSYCGAVPHFVDVEERTLGVDPFKLAEYLRAVAEIADGECINRKTGARIRAIVPMHAFGHPVDMDPLLEVCREYRLSIVEDAAESLGSYYKGKHTGTHGRVAALSYNGNKVITTGGGGAILTDDDELADRAKHLTTTAKVPHKWEYRHDTVGFNYRLPALNAALGCAQMERLPDFLERKRRLAEKYREAFEGFDGVRFFTEPEFARSNYWLNALVLDRPDTELRNEILEQTNNAGIMTRPVWTLLHRLPMYKDCPQMNLETSESLEARIINIPSSAYLGDNRS